MNVPLPLSLSLEGMLTTCAYNLAYENVVIHERKSQIILDIKHIPLLKKT